jgi:hypothetical protein
MRRDGEKNKPKESPSHVEELQARLERLESRVYAAKIAYLNRTTLDGKDIAYEDLTGIAKEYIQASYAIQKAKWGAIKVRISLAKLLR